MPLENVERDIGEIKISLARLNAQLEAFNERREEILADYREWRASTEKRVRSLENFRYQLVGATGVVVIIGQFIYDIIKQNLLGG